MIIELTYKTPIRLVKDNYSFYLFIFTIVLDNKFYSGNISIIIYFCCWPKLFTQTQKKFDLKIEVKEFEKELIKK